MTRIWLPCGDAIRYGRYEPDYSKCFIRKKPVLREIFASAYVDRVIQHWADLRLDPILEERFQAQGNVSKIAVLVKEHFRLLPI